MKYLAPLIPISIFVSFLIYIFGIGWYNRKIDIKFGYNDYDVDVVVWHNGKIFYSEYSFQYTTPITNIDSLKNQINKRIDRAIKESESIH